MYKNAYIFLFALLTLLTLLTLIQSQQLSTESTDKIIKKNILVFCFPGGKSHNFVFKEVFRHYHMRMKKENPNVEVKFYVMIHNFDLDLWSDTEHNVIGYGDIKSYEENFFKAMENAKADPVLGYSNFNKAMIHLYEDFLKDGILHKLRGLHFDLLLSDITNYLSSFLRDELKINKQIYLNPTCIYTWINEVFEYNASYHPLIGTTHTELMTFTERLTNQVFLFGTRFMYGYFKGLQSAVFRLHGYHQDIDLFPKDAFYMNQCVNGVHYAYSLPPNIVSAGAFLPRPSSALKNEDFNSFLSKFKKNIYVSQGTITKALRLEVLKEVFNHFPDVGFILSLKSEFHRDDLPQNVLLKNWVPQNDLLGDNRVHVFITHGGLNSILESLYHAKPMIVIGTSIDQVNGAVMVNYRKYGIGITNDKDISLQRFIDSIENVLKDETYKENCLVASKYVRETDGKDTFYYWLNHILEYGADHLIIPSIRNNSYLSIYNFDVVLAWLLILFLLYKLGGYLLIRFYSAFKRGLCTLVYNKEIKN